MADIAIDPHPMRMTILNVFGRRRSIEHRDRRINATAKTLTIQTVDEVGPVAVDCRFGIQRLKFGNQLIREYVVSIHRQHPRCFNSSVVQTEAPLVSMRIKHSLTDARLRITGSNPRRLIIAETINNDYVLRPTQLPQGAFEIRRLVVSEN